MLMSTSVWMTRTRQSSQVGLLHTHLALTMLPAFSSTISSKPMAKISMGLALLSVKKENHYRTLGVV